MLLRQLLTPVTETTDPTAAQGVEAHGYVYNKRDQREHWSKKFKSEQAAKAWTDSKNATILSIRPVQVKSQNRSSLESKLNELSPATLANYKKKAGADASAADKRGDYARGNKRMSGIVRATKKEFDNDSKAVSEARVDNPVSSAITRRILDQRPGLLKYGPQAVMYAVDQVAEWVGNVEDFEPSDVSEWVNQVSRYLQTQAGQGVAEGGYPEVDHMPGPTIKRTQTGCKRCHGKGYVYKTPDGETHPTNRPDAKIYKCGKCNGIGFVKTDVSESEYNPEYDDEAGMAQSNLVTAARAIEGLLDTIKDQDNLPEWVQEKIAKAEMMLVGTWDYLLSQKELGTDPKIKESNKIKGADGKACWKGYRYAGTKNGKDRCVPVGEDVENIMGALIENLLRK